MLTQAFSGASAGQALNGYTECSCAWADPSAGYKFNSGSVRKVISSGVGGAIATLGYTPASANYAVETILDVVTTSAFEFGLVGRYSGSNYYLFRWVDGVGVQLFKYTGSYSLLAGASATLSAGFNRFTLKMVGPTIQGILNGVVLCSVTDSSISAAGCAGYRAGSAVMSDTAGIHYQQITVNDAPNVSVSAGARTTTTVILSATATDGFGSYAYQWHKSQTSNFVPSGTTAISGATSSTLTDTPVSDGIWFYKCLVTDGAGAVGTSLQVVSARLRATIRIGFIGDSIMAGGWATGGQTIPQLVSDRLGRALNRPVTVCNVAVGGSTSGDWVQGSANYSAAASTFSSALSAGDVVMVCLGANDYRSGVSPATYSSNIQNLCNGLIALGYVPVLNEPVCVRDEPLPNYHDTQANIALGQQLPVILDGIANGTTILRGSRTIWEYTATHTGEQLVEAIAGGMNTAVHPNATGADSYSYQYLAILSKIYC